MQDRFSVSHKGQELGPFTKEELLQKIKHNELSALDYVYLDEKNDWVPLVEFLPGAGSTPGVPIPPPIHLDESKKSAGDGIARRGLGPMMGKPPQTTSKPTIPVTKELAVKQEPGPSIKATNTETIDLEVTNVAKLPVREKARETVRDVTRESHRDSIRDNVRETTLVDSKATTSTESKSAVSSETRSTVSTETKTGQIQLKDGVGAIELLQYTAGLVRLTLRDESRSGINAGKTEELLIKAAPASRLVLKGPASETQAGQSTTVTVEAHDKWGNKDTHFSGVCSITVTGAAEPSGSHELKLSGGQGTYTFLSKKAETVTVKLNDSNKLGLDLSATCNVNYVAGPAARLELIMPEETVAGQAVRVQVKAVDQYGNLATTCNDNVKLEVTGAAKKLNSAA